MEMSLVSELEQLVNEIEEEKTSVEKVAMPELAQKIARVLHVKADEVAILAVSNRWKHLHFLAPEVLKNVGFVPLTSNSALVARTARDNKPEINNNFSGVRHTSVFEGVKGATRAGESIQKIISVPILNEGKVVGVIQISRKGHSVAAAGPDFTSEDLGRVVAICGPLGKLVHQMTGE